MKKLLITIDTEGDNLWQWRTGDIITTANSKYLQRFQNLCDRYHFIPSWLANYEMIMDDAFVSFIVDSVSRNTAELGMHLHAWSTPPEFLLPVYNNGAPYLIEYPTSIMREKIETMTSTIVERTGIRPVVHRAGRWAMNEQYFQLLEEFGYLVDCSVTPHINWSSSVGQTENSKGSDYSNYPEEPYYVGKVLEIPLSVRKIHLNIGSSLLSRTKSLICGRYIQLRPNGNNIYEMLKLSRVIQHSKSDYLMFMIHSSELMPGGSPTFKTEESIEKLYDDLQILFYELSKEYEGCSLKELYDIQSSYTKSDIKKAWRESH